MATLLEQLSAMTVVVADTGELDAIRTFKPRDATTNPSLILAAAQIPSYQTLIDEALKSSREHIGHCAPVEEVVHEACIRGKWENDLVKSKILVVEDSNQSVKKFVERRKCFNCGKVGHIKPNCPESKKLSKQNFSVGSNNEVNELRNVVQSLSTQVANLTDLVKNLSKNE